MALGMEALARGYLVRYTTLDDLIRSLREADALGKLAAPGVLPAPAPADLRRSQLHAIGSR